MKTQAEQLVRHMRDEVGAAVTMRSRLYTDEELDEAERLALMGRDTDHLGVAE